MRASPWVILAIAAVLVPTRTLSQAQRQRSAAALALVEGVVYLNDKPVETNAVPSVLPGNAVLRTAQGRAAIALKRGGWLLLDADSSARVLDNGVYNFNRLDFLSGSAIVASDMSAPLVGCEGEFRLSTDGVFRFDIQPVNARGERPCQFRVFEGAAAVPVTSVTNALRPGEMMTCNRGCGDMTPTMEFSPDRLDGFDSWARQVRQQLGRR